MFFGRDHIACLGAAGGDQKEQGPLHRSNFLQDWTISAKVPQGGIATWRLDVKAAGSGVTGDLLAPLAGPFDLIAANLPYVSRDEQGAR